ncbi:unnamed protein product, partial [Rotaria sp. Silwood1]
NFRYIITENYCFNQKTSIPALAALVPSIQSDSFSYC